MLAAPISPVLVLLYEKCFYCTLGVACISGFGRINANTPRNIHNSFGDTRNGFPHFLHSKTLLSNNTRNFTRQAY
jgi:hypothetical protein